MPEHMKILTSRRAYEYRPDDLRLTTLSTKAVQEQILHLFHFQSSALGTPISTFGEVPATYPPGFVFNMGMFLSKEKHPIPIRFLHFEQRRIVFDIAGPSCTIDDMAEQLFQLLEGVQAADGSPVLGEPEHIFNYSEISAQFSANLSALFTPTVHTLFQKLFQVSSTGSKGMDFVPTVILQGPQGDREYAGVVSASDPHSFTLALRAGTRPEEHIYFSAAPLDSDAHIAYLTELEKALEP